MKEHVILTVEHHSLVIALALMALTTAVLLIGTLYMWCFHHPSKTKKTRSVTKEKKEKSENGSKDINGPQELEKEQNGEKSEVKDLVDEADVTEQEKKQNGEKSEEKDLVDEADVTKVLNEIQEDQQGVNKIEEKEEKVSEVRKRIPSNSSSVNNNESPVKSKIPIRRSTSRTKQS